MMDTALYILAAASGGFFGAGARHLVTWLLFMRMRVNAPTALLVVNAIGTLILGMISGDISHIKDNFEFCLLTVGFCGSFTTFSTFARQLLDYRTTRSVSRSFMYWAVSIAVGVVAFGGGYKLGEWIGQCRI